MLGHQDLKSTQRYAHPAAEAFDHAARRTEGSIPKGLARVQVLQPVETTAEGARSPKTQVPDRGAEVADIAAIRSVVDGLRDRLTKARQVPRGEQLGRGVGRRQGVGLRWLLAQRAPPYGRLEREEPVAHAELTVCPPFVEIPSRWGGRKCDGISAAQVMGDSTSTLPVPRPMRGQWRLLREPQPRRVSLSNVKIRQNRVDSISLGLYLNPPMALIRGD